MMEDKILNVHFQDSEMQMWDGLLVKLISLCSQLLDCFGIPVLMALSWFILRARYRLIHFIAVAVCLLGVGTMVGADILAGRQDSEGKESLIMGGKRGVTVSVIVQLAKEKERQMQGEKM